MGAQSGVSGRIAQSGGEYTVVYNNSNYMLTFFFSGAAKSNSERAKITRSQTGIILCVADLIQEEKARRTGIDYRQEPEYRKEISSETLAMPKYDES